MPLCRRLGNLLVYRFSIYNPEHHCIAFLLMVYQRPSSTFFSLCRLGKCRTKKTPQQTEPMPRLLKHLHPWIRTWTYQIGQNMKLGMQMLQIFRDWNLCRRLRSLRILQIFLNSRLSHWILFHWSCLQCLLPIKSSQSQVDKQRQVLRHLPFHLTIHCPKRISSGLSSDRKD